MGKARGQFVEQKLRLSSSFMCYQVYNNHCHDFGSHFVVVLKTDLDVQQSVIKFITVIAIILVTLNCAA